MPKKRILYIEDQAEMIMGLTSLFEDTEFDTCFTSFQNIEQLKLVFEQAVDNLVCDCWEDIEPSEIKTVSDWVDKQREFHTSDTRPTSTSSVDLKGKNLQMELTTNTEGYLWKLLIYG